MVGEVGCEATGHRPLADSRLCVVGKLRRLRIYQIELKERPSVHHIRLFKIRIEPVLDPIGQYPQPSFRYTKVPI